MAAGQLFYLLVIADILFLSVNAVFKSHNAAVEEKHLQHMSELGGHEAGGATVRPLRMKNIMQKKITEGIIRSRHRLISCLWY